MTSAYGSPPPPSSRPARPIQIVDGVAPLLLTPLLTLRLGSSSVVAVRGLSLAIEGRLPEESPDIRRRASLRGSVYGSYNTVPYIRIRVRISDLIFGGESP